MFKLSFFGSVFGGVSVLFGGGVWLINFGKFGEVFKSGKLVKFFGVLESNVEESEKDEDGEEENGEGVVVDGEEENKDDEKEESERKRLKLYKSELFLWLFIMNFFGNIIYIVVVDDGESLEVIFFF